MSNTKKKKKTAEERQFEIESARMFGKHVSKEKAAVLLRGKHKPTYTPHVDCGDHVIIINAAQAVLTGRKLEQKYYRHHTGYVGGLKEVQYKTLMAETPEKAMMLAVKGMIPDNTIGRKALTRCRIYRDANHGHAAQKPEEI